jgi:hypothetical protein
MSAREVEPITMTAAAAGAYAYWYVSMKPANKGKTPHEFSAEAKELLTGMIRKGAFKISDSKVNNAHNHS